MGSNYTGYGSGSGSLNPQPPPAPPSFQPPKQASAGLQQPVRNSPSHPSQLQSVRSSPSHPSQLQSVRSSPSHPSQPSSSVRSSPSHPSQLSSAVRSSPSHPSQIQGVRNSPSHPSQHTTIRNSPSQNPSQMVSSSINNQGSGGPIEPDDHQKLRFQVELEFVQSLGNPNYLHFLAQRGYMKDPNFINYVKYLQYWQQPQYVKYLKYPVSLHFLELLQHESFRKEIVSGQCARFLDDQVVLHWQHYSRKRAKLFESSANQQNQPNHSSDLNQKT